MIAESNSRISALVVDSNDEDRQWIRGTLEGAGIRVTSTADGRAALERLRSLPYELLIVALDLQGSVEGVRVARAARWRWPKASIIVSARDASLEAAIQGIDLGVDGYLDKPVSVQRIEETVDIALERQRQRCCVVTERHLLEWEGLSLDRERQEVALDGQPLHLTPTEFRILRHLMENAHRVISPQELVEVARGEEYSAEKAAEIARWHVHNLRQKIEPTPSLPRYVLSVHGVGYIFGSVDVT
jgi:DNA-binding response OmpR family regulator